MDATVTVNWDEQRGDMDGQPFASMGEDARNFLAGGATEVKHKKNSETIDIDDEDAERLSVDGKGQLNYD